MSAPRNRRLRIDDPLAPTSEHAEDPTAAAVPMAEGRLRELPLAQIHANPDQPRKRFDDASLVSLADSIRERGVLQPIIVRPSETGGYELVAGERRWRAAPLAAKATIPVLIDDTLDAGGSLELALIENVVRKDLTVIEEARTIAVLLEDLEVTGTVLAKRLGRSRADIVHTVRLLDLPDEAIELVDAGVLTKGHGKALLSEPDHHRRRALAERAAEGRWSVRMLEAEIASAEQRRPRPEPHPDHQAAAARLQDAIIKATGATPEPAHTSAAIKSFSIKPPQTGSPCSLTRAAQQPEHRCATWHTCEMKMRIAVLWAPRPLPGFHAEEVRGERRAVGDEQVEGLLRRQTRFAACAQFSSCVRRCLCGRVWVAPAVVSLRHPLRLLADVPELAQHAEVISHARVLGDAVAFEAVDVDVIDGE